MSSGNWMRYLKKIKPYTIKKAIRYLKHYGPKEFWVRLCERMEPEEVPYGPWFENHKPSEKELEGQRRKQWKKQPLISVVVPAYKTSAKFLREMIESLEVQTYTNWELCIANASPEDAAMSEVLREYTSKDARVKVENLKENLGIAENTNAAMEMAAGEYTGLLDHDDLLAPQALYRIVEALNQSREEPDVFYSDEDKVTTDLSEHFQPHFKPDYNVDLLCTVNYICHLFVVSRKVIEKVGGLRSEFDGAQDYDFVLRCVEAVKDEEICHIPKILYHWRCHEDSTAENPESKLYAFEAGRRAVQAHYERTGIHAEVFKGEYLGLYRTKFIRDHDPLISIIIPNKDHIDDLKRCMESIEQKSTYKNYEYIIVENNSTDSATFDYYKKLEAENPKVRMVYWDGVFNYSAINNYGASFAKGEYLLLLNNDTEIINPDCLEELLGYCMRKDVGAVGARLYYEDDTIQHAGVVIGFGGIAGHCFVQQKRGTTGYCHRIICAQDYSAVTAACMMVKKSAFDAVGGLSEELAVAFNDIDFCMKLRKAGYLIVYNPYAELYHYESKSRGLEDTPEKVARFNKEIATFEKKWPEILKNGDPYYNPNLTLKSQDFSLKRI